MSVRAVRGATTVVNNNASEILEATGRLLKEIVDANYIEIENIISVIFTTTQDLDAAFPAKAARELGWTYVPLLDAVEVDVPGSLPKCIRVMLHFNTSKSLEEIKHIYLNDAVKLRPDLSK